METKGITPKIINAAELLTPKVIDKNSTEKTDFVCPVCNETMQKKEGKEYFMCTKHWGYPAMIEKGEVRERFAKQINIHLWKNFLFVYILGALKKSLIDFYKILREYDLILFHQKD